MNHVSYAKKGLRRMLALLLLAAMLTPMLLAGVSAAGSDVDYGSYTDAELNALAKEAEKNISDYSTTSTKKTKLELPYKNERLAEALHLEVKFTKNGAIYIMPKPKSGYGVLGTIKAGTQVTVIAESKGYYFFIADDGRMGWNGKAYFTDPTPAGGNRGKTSPGSDEEGAEYLSFIDEELLALAEDAANNCRDYTTISNKKVALQLPDPENYLSEVKRLEVKFTRGGAIYIMPKPAAGNGVLGTITAGTIVTVIAERKGFYFFIADDGRMGWNGKDYFIKPQG